MQTQQKGPGRHRRIATNSVSSSNVYSPEALALAPGLTGDEFRGGGDGDRTGDETETGGDDKCVDRMPPRSDWLTDVNRVAAASAAEVC